MMIVTPGCWASRVVAVTTPIQPPPPVGVNGRRRRRPGGLAPRCAHRVGKRWMNNANLWVKRKVPGTTLWIRKYVLTWGDGVAMMGDVPESATPTGTGPGPVGDTFGWLGRTTGTVHEESAESVHGTTATLSLSPGSPVRRRVEREGHGRVGSQPVRRMADCATGGCGRCSRTIMFAVFTPAPRRNGFVRVGVVTSVTASERGNLPPGRKCRHRPPCPWARRAMCTVEEKANARRSTNWWMVPRAELPRAATWFRLRRHRGISLFQMPRRDTEAMPSVMSSPRTGVCFPRELVAKP